MKNFDLPTLIESGPTSALRFTTPTAVTLFSGVGSSSLALHRLGYQVLAHDFLPEAVDSLHQNGFDVVGGDIRQVDFTSALYNRVDVVIGGPPCQPFSQGGRNAGEDDHRDMIPDFQRAVAHIQPRLFVLENVRGLAGPRHKAYLERRVSEFEALGYVVKWRVLDAADYFIGQSRKRLFVIGIRADVAQHLRERDGYDVTFPKKSTTKLTMAEALGWDEQTAFVRNQQAPEPARVDWEDERWRWPFERPSTTVVGSFRPEVQAAPGYRSAGDGPRQNAPGSVVTTLSERLVLQGLPADWKVAGSKSKQDLQVGNSVPTPLIEEIANLNT